MSSLGENAVTLLQELIRFNTVNPPGNELPAQLHIAALLEGAGFDVEMHGAEESRPNLVATLGDPSSGPSFGLLSHVDTVLADPADWSRDPWSGDLVDGMVWGRGAIDMKSQTAAGVAAAVDLASGGWRPQRGALKVIVVSDEETGGALGARWLVREHHELARCDWLINEGGGEIIPYGDRHLYGVCCGEKGVYRFSITTRGTAGHASMPMIGDNALLKAAPLLEKFAASQPKPKLIPEAEELLRRLGADPSDPRAAMETLVQADQRLAAIISPLLGVTFSPTRIRASEKLNVIPAKAVIDVDCRIPPGLGEEDVLAAVDQVLGEGDYEFDFIEVIPGNRSAAGGELWDAISEWLPSEDPEGETIPVMLPGYTDSVAFREVYPDLTAYGFFPQTNMSIYDTSPLVHGADERIDARDVAVAARCYSAVARRLLG
jgi:acetylornithine deacetylase/succinyl-diaminopimelate desuccinylase-like protein